MKKVPIEKVITSLRREMPRFQETSLLHVSRYNNPFTILISCILSLRTRDPVTVASSDRLFAKADTPPEILSLSEEEIQKLIYPVSFYRVKARNIRLLCQQLLDEYGGKVPHTMPELLSLPNVGRKTANIVLTLGFHTPGIAVDTHVHRISNRLGIVRSKTPEETEFALMKKIPQKDWIAYNDLLVTWGQNICTPISPKCSQCVIRPLCNRDGVTTMR